MFEAFPELNKNQVALIRAERNTGIVLDHNLQWAEDAAQKVYTVFESLDDAINAAQNIQQEHPQVEIVIYGQEEQVLKYLE